MTKKFKYAVNTNNFNREQVSYAKMVEIIAGVGADGIEWGLPKLEQAADAAMEMSKLTRDAGLEIVGFLNAARIWEIDLLRRWSELTANAGGKQLRIAHPWFGYNYEETLHQRDSFNDLVKRGREGLEKLEPLSKEFGIRYVLEMHGGSVAASPPCARQMVDGLNPDSVGIIYDPANGVLEGLIRPRGAVEILGEYLAYVHAKNLFFHFSGQYQEGMPKRAKWEYKRCPLESGMVDYVEIAFALKCNGFSGWLSLEEFFCPDGGLQTIEDLRRGIEFLTECETAAPDTIRKPYTTFND